MDIGILTKLQQHAQIEFGHGTGRFLSIEGISLSDIEQLETNWNDGNPFPKSLRELLYLAGKRCYALDYGAYENLNQLQAYKRDDLLKIDNIAINRPYFIIDVYSGEVTFVYLDESQEDPIVNIIEEYDPLIISSTEGTLSDLIDACIEDVKKGYNPF